MSKFRILVVDDEPDIRMIVERALVRDPSLATRACASGREALAVAAEWQPHLVLLDFMMPGLDGPATLRALRADVRTAGIAVIYLTARASAQDRDGLMSLGAAGAIAKPFELAVLREAVRSHLQAPSLQCEGSVSALDQATAAEKEQFRARLRTDAMRLRKLEVSRGAGAGTSALEEVRLIVHKLAGAAGLYGFDHVSRAAAALEQVLVEVGAGGPAWQAISTDVQAFISAVEAAATPSTDRIGEPVI